MKTMPIILHDYQDNEKWLLDIERIISVKKDVDATCICYDFGETSIIKVKEDFNKIHEIIKQRFSE